MVSCSAWRNFTDELGHGGFLLVFVQQYLEKAIRHGFAFRHNRGRQKESVANLLLIGALGMLATWLMGLVAQARGVDRGMQANTERKRRVLSVFFIGTRLLTRNATVTPGELRHALLTLQAHAHEQRPFAV